MISKKLLAGLTIGTVGIAGALGLWMCQGDAKQDMAKTQSRVENKPGGLAVLGRLLTQIQKNNQNQINEEQPADNGNQRAEDEQQWQVKEQKRLARIEQKEIEREARIAIKIQENKEHRERRRRERTERRMKTIEELRFKDPIRYQKKLKRERERQLREAKLVE